MDNGNGGDVYRLVFELTARATDVPYDVFLVELVQGLAAHYRANICRLHIGEETAATGGTSSAAVTVAVAETAVVHPLSMMTRYVLPESMLVMDGKV